MRAFLAIELSREVRDRVAALQAELEPRLGSARWVPPRNLHLTLRFLGETSEDTVRRLIEILRGPVGECESFTLLFRGSGCFPNPRRPRALWVGIDHPPPALFRLHAVAEQAVRRAGLEPDERAFRPHLTVARFKKPDRRVESILAPLDDRAFGETLVSRIVLFESRLSPEGASYFPVQELPLSKA